MGPVARRHHHSRRRQRRHFEPQRRRVPCSAVLDRFRYDIVDGSGHVNYLPLWGGNARGTVNFNGGLLTVTGNTANLFATTGLDSTVTLNVLAGGAKINTAGNDVTITQALAGTAGDGGLTKTGAGKLTAHRTANTYTGQTTLSGRNPGIGHGRSGPGPHRWWRRYSTWTSPVDLRFPGDNPAALVDAAMKASYNGGAWTGGKFQSTTAPAAGLTLGWMDDGAGTSS